MKQLVLSVAFAGTLIATGATANDDFTLEDIPEISNKTPIHVALEAGGGADLIIPFLERFSAHTGVPLTHESMVFATLYSKQVIELQGGTGAYDLVVTETSWTNEWEDYLTPLEELAAQFDPDGVEGFRSYIAGHDPGILRMASTRDGVLVGVPYYTYTMINIYREDLFEDEGERAAFAERYGYDLAPPRTTEQLRDIAEFFSRAAGETLRGETLAQPFYGVSMMAGRFPHVQDEITAMLWGDDARWARTVRDGSGEVIAFEVTDADMERLEAAFSLYQELMGFAPPGSENAFWDFATAQFVAGNTAMIPYMYAPLWNWSNDVGQNVEGAKSATTTVVGERPYTGAFHFAPSRASGNPEAAYWLLKFIGSHAAQLEMANTGWASARRDALDAVDMQSENAYRQFGWIAPVLTQWEAQEPDVDTYLHFNSGAFGKLYEQMTIIGHENATGARTPAESVEAWRRAFDRFQGRFDTIEVR
jgi:multiple sugar transport system substrate-binding protein